MKKLLPLAVTLAMASTTTFANDAKIAELQEQINALADQVEANSGNTSKTTIGGYGELHYNNFENKDNKIDFHRFVLFFAHQYNDDIEFFSEFELEHALSGGSKAGVDGKPGEVELEQAYIQFNRKNSNIKAGVFLIPVGILNETHEPDTFYGVERNPVEKSIIPTTWWEAGVMYSGHNESGLSYDVAVHSGLETSTSVRSGRQKVAKAVANDLAYTGRIKYTGISGLQLASTVNYQTDMDQQPGGVGAGTLIEMHAIYTMGKLKLTGLQANWSIEGLTNTSGTILEASYKITPTIGVFARQNMWNDSGSDKTQFDTGVNFYPHEKVAIKFDIQQQNTAAGSTNAFNIGVGYSF